MNNNSHVIPKRCLVQREGPRLNKGETLVEAIIAVSVMMLIIAPAAALNISALRLISFNRSDLVASALAEEGLEIVRAIRDTNVLRFASKIFDPDPLIGDCWLTYPFSLGGNSISLDECDLNPDANMIATGYFRVRREVSPAIPSLYFQWLLEPNGSSPSTSTALSSNLTASDSFFRLRLDESSIVGHTHFVDDTHTYIHDDSDTRGVATNFYREIYLAREAFDGAEVLHVTSRVRYRTGSRIATVVRSTILTPYPPQE